MVIICHIALGLIVDDPGLFKVSEYRVPLKGVNTITVNRHECHARAGLAVGALGAVVHDDAVAGDGESHLGHRGVIIEVVSAVLLIPLISTPYQHIAIIVVIVIIEALPGGE